MLLMDLEKDVVEDRDAPTKAQCDSFKAPAVPFGSPVILWPRGVRGTSKSEAMIGWAMRSNGTATSIFAVDQHGGFRVWEQARHIDDPTLKRSSDIRAEGGWDFTEFDKLERERRDDIDKRLSALETALVTNGTSDREVLLLLAKKAGMTGYSKMKNDELRQKLVELRSAESSTETTES